MPPKQRALIAADQAYDDTVGRHARRHRQLVRVSCRGLQELLEQNFAKTDKGEHFRHID
ncbi:MAG: hypothetical protein ACLQBA_02220 [Candidatus Binataceae bacterium]